MGEIANFDKGLRALYRREMEISTQGDSSGKNHRYLMRLDLSDWAQRHTYFIGTVLRVRGRMRP